MQKEIIEAILDEPVLLATVKPKRTWRDRILFRTPKETSLYIKGATASTMFKITELLLSIKQTSDVKDNEGQIYDLMNSNIKHIVQFLAIAIHNAPGNPSPELIHTLNNRFTIEQLQAMASVAYRRLGIEPFFGIMGLLRSPELKIVSTPDRTAPGQDSAEQ